MPEDRCDYKKELVTAIEHYLHHCSDPDTGMVRMFQLVCKVGLDRDPPKVVDEAIQHLAHVRELSPQLLIIMMLSILQYEIQAEIDGPEKAPAPEFDFKKAPNSSLN